MRKKCFYTLILLFVLILGGMPHPSTAKENKDTIPLTLSEAIKIAREQSYRIKAAEDEVKGADYEMKSARTYMLPQVSASYGATAMSETPYQSFDGQTVNVYGKQDIQWDVTVTQPLFHLGIYHGYKTAKIGIEAKELAKEITIQDITRDTKKAYYNVLLAKKISTVAEEAVEALTAHKEDAQKYYDQGLIPQNDLLRAQVALANAEQQKTSALGHRKLAASQLNLLLNYELDRELRLQDIDTVTPLNLFKNELILEALENRPELLAVRVHLKILDRQVKIAKSEYFPQIALIGQYQQRGEDLLANENDYNNQYNSLVSVQAKWNLFQWGRNVYSVKKNASQKSAVQEQLKLAEDGITLEVENAYLQAKVAERNIATAKSALAQARENWRMTKLQFQQQVATSTDVLDARTFHSQADSNYLQALYGYMIAIADLERAVGRTQE